MKLFVEDIKGYIDSYTDVKKVSIKKIDNKNTLIIKFNNKEEMLIPLNEIRLAFMTNLETMEEYFRYEK